MEDIFATFDDIFEWLPEFDLDFALEISFGRRNS